MCEAQASVILRPISPLGPESSITRSFTLSSSNPIFEIGRSSKREVKNRTPAKDNGWFDSRVMSRDHAELGFNMDKEKMIYIRDFGSTHGTWLNNVKLVTGEDTPLLSGDILRFGVDVDRGDEEFPALSVRCNVTWSEPTPTTDLDNYSYESSDLLYNHTVGPASTTFETKPASELRPSSSTNTFCVPDDEESDAEEIKINQNASFKVGDGEITVLYDESSQDNYQAPHVHEMSMKSRPHDSGCEEAFPIEDSHEEYSDSSNGEDSEFDSEPSSFSQLSDDEQDEEVEVEHFAPLNLPIPISDDDNSGSEEGSDIESDILYDDDYSVRHDVDEEECIDPGMLAQDENAVHSSLEEAIQNFTPAGVIPKPHFEVDIQEQVPCPIRNQHIIFPTHFPLTPITPVMDHKRDEGDGSQRLGRLSIRDVLNNYQDGPFVGPSDATSKDVSSSEEEIAAESSSPASLKRKASEIESQDAQIPESIVSPSETPNLETISQSEVAEVISSALSESCDEERPNKRVKATHEISNHLASYTATAIISALLGGLGTIALLASLPAEYFQ